MITIARFVITLLLVAGSSLAKIDSDVFKSMDQICAENGFATESHTLVTSDGYVLTLYRILGTFEDMHEKKPAVLLMHAQDANMMQWIVNDSERANAFILARAGYDVWLGNNRGSSYGNAHISLNPSQKEFWDFYQEEMGVIDSPLFIDFILETTGLEQLSYIGHSEGNTQFFIGASLFPDYFKEKVNLFIALAPCPTTANMPIGWAESNYEKLEYVLVDLLGYYSWFYPMPRLTLLFEMIVDLMEYIVPEVAANLKNNLINGEVNNIDRFDMMMYSFPAGQSYRAMIWYYQQTVNNSTRLYDYGVRKNQEVYGQTEPPHVPFENFSTPTALFSGSIDTEAPPQVVDWIAEQLGSNVVFNVQYYLDHSSFAIGKDMTWFSEDAVQLLRQYNQLPL